MARRAAAAVVLLVGVLLAGCGSGRAERDGLTVYAASSLSDAFTEIGREFQAQEGAEVRFNFAASSTLALQIAEGAPADVFASADQRQMAAVVDAGEAAGPEVFATNLPVAIVPAGSSLESFEELAKPGLRLVLAAPEVPIGRYARDILARASDPRDGIASEFAHRVLANLVSNEPNVRSVLTKVQLGEADAGIVYETDARIAHEDVRIIPIPDAYTEPAEYSIAVTSRAEPREEAEAFVAFVRSPAGQTILARHGFGVP